MISNEPRVGGDASVRNPHIDLLRGVAILLVVIHHLQIRMPMEDSAWFSWLPARFLRGVGSHGYEAVFLFFVISGFLITSNALSWWGRLDRIDLRVFYARRFARIVPCLLVLVLVLSFLHGLGVTHYTIVHANQSLPRAIVATLGFHVNWYEGQTGYLPGNWDVLWSLSIEEMFYIAFPVVCLLLRWRGLLVAFLVGLAISIPWARAALAGNEIWQEKAYLPGMAAIAAGVLAALLARRVQPPRAGAVIALAMVGALGFGVVVFTDDVLWQALKDFGLLLLTGSAACLVLAGHWLECSSRSGTYWGTASVRAFGRLSYEIYLTHMFVVFTVLELFERSGADARFEPLWYGVTVALCLGLGVLVDQGLSTPCNRALRKWLITAPLQPSPRG